MIITDLYPGIQRWEIPDPYYQNLVALLPKLNAVEEAFGSAFKITRGFSTWAQHKEIYRQINDVRILQKLPEIPIPLHSAHLIGMAVDIFDPRQSLQSFLLANRHYLTDNGLWCESFKFTVNWVHCQSRPASQLFFIP